MKYLLAPVMLLFFFGLLSCMNIKSSIVSFHKMDSVQPKTYFFSPLPEQQGSLEYEHYKKNVIKNLKRYDWQLSEDGEMRIEFAYRISRGDTTESITAHTSPSPASTIGDIVDPSNKSMWTVAQTQTTFTTSTIRTYSREFKIRIYDNLADSEGNKNMVLEGTVISVGEIAELTTVLPYLIESFFDDFPGVSGEVRKVMKF